MIRGLGGEKHDARAGFGAALAKKKNRPTGKTTRRGVTEPPQNPWSVAVRRFEGEQGRKRPKKKTETR